MSGTLQVGFLNTYKNLTVIIEPWCSEVSLAYDSYLMLYIEYEVMKPLLTQITDGYFTVHAWGNCRAKVFVDKIDVTPPALRYAL